MKFIKKSIWLSISIVFISLVSGCSDKSFELKQEGLTKTEGATAVPEPNSSEYVEDDPSDPYYLIFKQLFQTDDALNDKIKYIAIDFSKADTADASDFIALIKSFCDEHGYTLLEDNYEGLVEKGYIKELYFEEGIIISFENVILSAHKMTAEGTKWRSGLGAIGAKFSLLEQDGKWELSETTNHWIS
jgi:hypothetical protein